jgi:chromosome segregation ATPase
MAKDHSQEKRNLKRRLRELNAFDKEIRKKREKAAKKVNRYEKKLQRAQQDYNILANKEWAANDKWFELDEKLQKILKNEKRAK